MINIKEQTEENEDKMERLKRIYAKWREKQRLEELLETEKYLINEPDYRDLEKPWQSD